MNGDPDPDPELSVWVCGDDGVGAVGAAVEAAGATRQPRDDADLVVAVGEDALLGLTAEPPTLPVLPVDGGGPHAVAHDEIGEAIASVAAGTADRVEHPVLGVRVGDERAGRALADVSLVTSEPARISEYAIRTRNRPVADFRADGVVVATPLGSAGYARAAGGPVLDPGTGLAVVPVSPFATAFDTWVVRPPVALSIERDDGPVSLVVDDAATREVAPHATVDVDVAASVELVVPPVADDEWKSSNE